jgi:hypothetical protein
MINRATRHSSLSTDTSTTPNRPGVPRWRWVLMMLLAAGIVSGIAGLLSHASGSNVPASILTGGGAFAGTLGLLLAIAHYASAA